MFIFSLVSKTMFTIQESASIGQGGLEIETVKSSLLLVFKRHQNQSPNRLGMHAKLAKKFGPTNSRWQNSFCMLLVPRVS